MPLGQKRFSVALGLTCLCALWLTIQLFRRDGGLPRFKDNSSVRVLQSWPHIEVVIPPNEQTWPYRVFESSPLKPPNISIGVSNPGLADGYLFLTPSSRNGARGEEQEAPYIFTSENELVYAFKSSTPLHFNGFRVQQIDGRQHLTYWRGESVVGHGYGKLVILDNEYQQSTLTLDATVRQRPDLQNVPGVMDFHEQEITTRNTVIVTAYNETPTDLSPVGGPNDGSVADSMFFEVDLDTNQVLFSWSALDHFLISTSYLPIVSDLSSGQLAMSYDSFHINSVQLVGQDYLISSRHNWAVYLVSGDDGHIIWTLSGDGRDSDFGPLPPEGQFRWQHDVRAYNVTENGMQLSLFDNHCRAIEECTTPSRGILLHLQLPPDPTEIPQVLRSVATDERLFAKSQGSFQIGLPNDNQVLSYGPSPVVREFGPPGEGSKLLWEGRFGRDDLAQSYRVYKNRWHATPREWDPSLAVIKKRVGQDSGLNFVHVHVSWNGATDLQSWNVYTGPEAQGKQSLVGIAFKEGFETVFELELFDSPCVQVAAVQGGQEVRWSNKACL